MKSNTPSVPLVAALLVLGVLLLLDLAFDAPLEDFAAFIPIALWTGLSVIKGRA